MTFSAAKHRGNNLRCSLTFAVSKHQANTLDCCTWTPLCAGVFHHPPLLFLRTNDNFCTSPSTNPLPTDYGAIFDSYDMEQAVKDFIAMEGVWQRLYGFAGMKGISTSTMVRGTREGIANTVGKEFKCVRNKERRKEESKELPRSKKNVRRKKNVRLKKKK